ncbi:MAG: hypothetical protein PHY42_02495 [Bacilli bacterium]|nr:hypothetical protein [Bacilli bacterium]
MKIKHVLVIFMMGLVCLTGCQKNDEAKIYADKIEMSHLTEIIESFALPKRIDDVADVTWSSSHGDIIVISEYPEWESGEGHNDYYKAWVTLPIKQTTVTLTATVLYGNQIARKTFDVRVWPNRYPYLSIEQAKELTPSKIVQIQGVVVAKFDSGFVLFDEIDYVFVKEENAQLAVGDIVCVRGVRVSPQGVPQIDCDFYEKLDEKPDTFNPFTNINAITIEDLMTHDEKDSSFYGTLYQVSGIIVSESDGYYPYRFIHPIHQGTSIKVSYLTDDAGKQELRSAEDKYMSAIVMIFGYQEGEFNLLYIPGTLEENTYPYTTDDYLNMALESLEDKYNELNIYKDISLDATIGIQGHEATITWTSKNHAILSNDGKVVSPLEETIVEMKVVLRIEEKTKEATINLIIKPKEITSDISSLIALTPEKSVDPMSRYVIEGVVVGHQDRGYWVADATGAILVWLGSVVTSENAPEMGTFIRITGCLTTMGEASQFTVIFLPLSPHEILDNALPTLLEPIPITFDRIFGYNVGSKSDAKSVGLTYYGKQITITGTVVGTDSNNVWKIHDPLNPSRWILLTNLASSTRIKDLEEETITITLMVSKIYFTNDTSHDDYHIGTFGGVYFFDYDLVEGGE